MCVYMYMCNIYLWQRGVLYICILYVYIYVCVYYICTYIYAQKDLHHSFFILQF